MKYDPIITSVDHCRWLMDDAERRYQRNIVTDYEGMFVAEDENGLTHTDAVLRALSFYKGH